MESGASWPSHLLGIFLFLAVVGTSRGTKVTFFERQHFEGDSLEIFAEEGKCTNLIHEWNDRASSLSTHDNCILVFEHGDCHGRSTRMEPGSPNHHDLQALNFDKTITSVQKCTPPEKVCRGITVDVDTSEAPDMHEFGQKAKALMEKWYPRLCNVLHSPTYVEFTRVSLRIDNSDGVAGADAFGRTITCSARYYREHPDDLGSLIHELAHVIQRYSKCDGWITEGIADWTRRIMYEPVKPGKPGPDDRYYTQGVYFLNWLGEKYPGSMGTLNRECREGIYEDGIFVRMTGNNPDQLWDEMMREI